MSSDSDLSIITPLPFISRIIAALRAEKATRRAQCCSARRVNAAPH
ncbi:TPA: hypothetical protein HA281_04945 [Candidatus Woesearchaeota archaeon]|nr:hypothetical protein [Candidatus Woesearchaeota archaeon]HII65026.1 hypothetical protein [Candidatus Woesearchaeota archaeon]